MAVREPVWGPSVLASLCQLQMCIRDRQYPFGTDWMGRDMLARTLTGLSLSIRIGVLTAAVSAVIALAIGIAAALLGPKVDAALSWCMDLVMGIPHILLVMLISLAFGRGFTGVVAGVALSLSLIHI